jgi:hypothetical protein
MLTLTYPERSQTSSDLAAGLTDLALELLSMAGVRGNSVEMELDLWRALTAEIDREFTWGRPAASHVIPQGGLVERVIHRAALRVAGASKPGPNAQTRPVAVNP